ncbi:hypothetical protein GCE86_02315 [Micromonospora terminaliae]|uniref:Uncharacterized protein n=1 Tax=Micromonospora terminaliae TaxID=1914461 RepID=A0AAJ2ZDR0_9ACTN|nr:hypothetical protein [Micromonospora terminaliae]NES28272.1 hypothetical protein [Micromonospora terminaliae]QGL45988.1 hypothetical protein GCE86_02315 [Micromonospora terminaliae]
MSQPPTGAGGYPPQPPGGTVYGSPYGAQPEPSPYPAAQPEPTLPQPTAPVPGQYAPGAAPVPPPGAPVSAPGYPQPMSAPPTSGAGSAPGYPQPMSAPPTSGAAPGYPQPMSAPPTSVPPFSGAGSAPGYPQPMSAPPGYPMSAPPGPVPPYGAPASGGGKGRAVLILGIVAGLLLVLGGVMTGLYVTTNGKLHKSEQQVSQRDGTITANRQEIDKLKADLQTVRDKLADTEQDLTGTKNDRDEQARQKKVIASCLDKLTKAMVAASRGDKAGFDAANKGLDKVCDEAENYL